MFNPALEMVEYKYFIGEARFEPRNPKPLTPTHVNLQPCTLNGRRPETRNPKALMPQAVNIHP